MDWREAIIAAAQQYAYAARCLDHAARLSESGIRRASMRHAAEAISQGAKLLGWAEMERKKAMEQPDDG